MNPILEPVERTAQHRRFNLYGGCEPISETLLGRVTHWKPTGSIAFKHRDASIRELMRFQFPMNSDVTIPEIPVFKDVRHSGRTALEVYAIDEDSGKFLRQESDCDCV